MYFNLKHAKEIIKEGHELGMHTVKHHWLNSLNYNHQAHEIKENINIYASLGPAIGKIKTNLLKNILTKKTKSYYDLNYPLIFFIFDEVD